MFKTPIRITGKHAAIAQKYSYNSNTTDENSFLLIDTDGKQSIKRKVYLFSTLIDCFMTATMLGIVEDRTATDDKSSDASATVFMDMIDKKRKQLERIYQHMVLSRETELTDDQKIKRAFGILPDDLKKTEFEKFKKYLLGGLEIIDETFKKCESVEEFCDLIVEFKIKYQVE